MSGKVQKLLPAAGFFGRTPPSKASEKLQSRKGIYEKSGRGLRGLFPTRSSSDDTSSKPGNLHDVIETRSHLILASAETTANRSNVRYTYPLECQTKGATFILREGNPRKKSNIYPRRLKACCVRTGGRATKIELQKIVRCGGAPKTNHNECCAQLLEEYIKYNPEEILVGLDQPPILRAAPYFGNGTTILNVFANRVVRLALQGSMLGPMYTTN